jgi:hypothetical protein
VTDTTTCGITTFADATSGTLFTAKSIKENCPTKLVELGERITEAIKRADRHEEMKWQAADTASKLLTEARQACDKRGFHAFCERFGIGRSRACQLLAIGAGKKTYAQTRAENVERNKQFRARKKAAQTVHHVMDESQDVSAPLAGYDANRLREAWGEVDEAIAAGDIQALKMAVERLQREAGCLLRAEHVVLIPPAAFQ